MLTYFDVLRRLEDDLLNYRVLIESFERALDSLDLVIDMTPDAEKGKLSFWLILLLVCSFHSTFVLVSFYGLFVPVTNQMSRKRVEGSGAS